ncbi:transcriptional regulator [PinkBerry-associated phage LS06-2018-MD08]|nr:transcriptional regulator [PinkBerry-associated phage LS06-2018-MD08]
MKGLKQSRKDRELSQQELALLMGVTVQTISNWECGRRQPNVSATIKLIRVLECDYNKLMGEE